VEAIFEALSICAALHPDKDSGSDDGEDAFIDPATFETFIGGEDEELSEVGRVRSDSFSVNRYAPY
jgi:nucleotide-sensitive chloride channel 1A